MSSIHGYTLTELALRTGGKLIGNPDHLISGVNSLDAASESDASFYANARYEEALKASRAGVICTSPEHPLLPGRNYLLGDPSAIFQMIVEVFAAKGHSGFSDIHPTAVIHPTAQIGQNVTIGPNTVIDRLVIIGNNTRVYPLAYIGPCASIGEDCIIHALVTIRENCRIGARVILQPGCVIGSCGFGYLRDKEGRFQKLEQMGNVVIEDDVEIGANTTIDRARFKSTIIRRGAKIDNLVQIAHNVEIGEDNGIAAQTGIAGSAKTGCRNILGGQVGMAGHIATCDDASFGSQSGISKNITSPGAYRGTPAIPMNEFNRQMVYMRKLEGYVKIIKELQAKVLGT